MPKRYGLTTFPGLPVTMQEWKKEQAWQLRLTKLRKSFELWSRNVLAGSSTQPSNTPETNSASKGST